MKIVLLFCLLLSNFISFAQHPDLLQRWYVESLTIDGIATPIPVDNMTFPYTYLDFYTGSSGLTLSANETINYYDTCGIGFVSYVNHVSNSSFSFLNFNSSSGVATCTTSMIEFMTAYIAFFNSTVENDFNYTITVGANNSKILTVTNSNNDFITLTNKFLTPPPPELYVNDFWFLHQLIINNVAYLANSPTLNIPEHPWIDFNFVNEKEWLYQRICFDFFAGIQNFVYSNNLFYYYHPHEDLYGCQSDYDMQFHDMNLYFYNQLAPGPFHYSVSDSGIELQLTITAPNGDQAIYGNHPLSMQEYLDNNFKIYPNPVSDILTIENTNQIDIKNITLSSILGQQLQTFNPTQTIDFSNYHQGVYQLTIETKQGAFLNKMIIKE